MSHARLRRRTGTTARSRRAATCARPGQARRRPNSGNNSRSSGTLTSSRDESRSWDPRLAARCLAVSPSPSPAPCASHPLSASPPQPPLRQPFVPPAPPRATTAPRPPNPNLARRPPSLGPPSLADAYVRARPHPRPLQAASDSSSLPPPPLPIPPTPRPTSYRPSSARSHRPPETAPARSARSARTPSPVPFPRPRSLPLPAPQATPREGDNSSAPRGAANKGEAVGGGVDLSGPHRRDPSPPVPFVCTADLRSLFGR